ncbi:serine-threonine protein kinase 19-domain-containing protein [Dendryphion nanum]|uniref:Serine-threonine protein kinase 19-domain-containing protein n=1 Tax=Dendryphion nanum TaxID=256645 RepID=A0A9P9E7H2_9PLEO|nr:serine-threonine protein kinase 19-domain-containing protein [Dendryphion nanum]
MSFQVTAARSSRIKKTRKQSAAAALGLKRTISAPSSSSSSSLSSIPRRKSSQSAPSTSHDDEQLDDTGVVASLAADLNFRDVPQYMEYIRNRMFSDIPETGAGMNSGRIAEVLNYRLHLPPIVTVAHIDALSTSSTTTEREIVELAQAGILRRVVIPNRGVGAAAVGDGIASVLEWHKAVNSHDALDDALKAKYIAIMNANPTSGMIPGTSFSASELSTLTTAGFLTTANTVGARSSLFVAPSAGSLGSLASLSSSGSRHAAGSLGAVGGSDATKFIPGGGTGQQRSATTVHYNFSLPNTGSHIKLLVEARSHLISLLKKSKFKEAPMQVLRERWNGGFFGVLPGRTKKWKQFWGMRFEWILEECVGAGLMECFETGSVGAAVRLV